MKRFIITALVLALAGTVLNAQEFVDSLVYVPVSQVNDTLVGQSIYDVLPRNVHVDESFMVHCAIDETVEENHKAMVDGFRIRIYFDNTQTAREESEQIYNRFRALYPAYNAYRVHVSPFFKVTVGDFRTKADAQKALKKIAMNFPSSFIVKEQMKNPMITDEASYRIDTVKVSISR